LLKTVFLDQFLVGWVDHTFVDFLNLRASKECVESAEDIVLEMI